MQTSETRHLKASCQLGLLYFLGEGGIIHREAGALIDHNTIK